MFQTIIIISKTIINGSAMWKDIAEIGPDCIEHFLDRERIPELEHLGNLLAGVSSLEGNYRIGRANSNYHIIEYFTAGRGLLHTDNGTRYVEPNSVMILPSGSSFLFEICDNSWSSAWFCIEDGERWSQIKNSGISLNHCAQAPVIRHLLYSLYYETNYEHRLSLTKILVEHLHTSLLQPSQGYNKQNRLSALFEEIENKLHYLWTIEEMANRMHCSPSHLHKLCQFSLGRSPIQQLIHMRIQRAKQLLEYSDWPLLKIANCVGYQDAFNFSNRFKKSVGISPSKYRNKKNDPTNS